MIHYSFLANFCWTFCIAFNFYRMIVAQDRDTRSYEKVSIIVTAAVPYSFHAVTCIFLCFF